MMTIEAINAARCQSLKIQKNNNINNVLISNTITIGRITWRALINEIDATNTAKTGYRAKKNVWSIGGCFINTQILQHTTSSR